MPRSPAKALAISHACTHFEEARERLRAALDRSESRVCLDALVELCELYVECTGGTLRTLEYRRELDEFKTRVTTRPHLRSIPMPFEIHVAEDCLFCHHSGVVRSDGAGGYACTCSYCYDGTEDASLMSRTSGSGATPQDAIATWLDAQEELVPEHVGYWISSPMEIAQAAFKLQEGWTFTETERGRVWGPVR